MTILSSLLLMGQTGPAKVVEAQKFSVRDANGVVRAQLGVAGGTVELNLADKGGMQRLSVHVDPDGSPGLMLIEKDGKTVRGEMSLKADQRMYLALGDRNAKPRLWLEAKPDGSSGVSVMDKDGKNRAVLAGPMVDGATELTFFDVDGRARLTLGARDVSGVLLFDKDGKTPRGGLLQKPDGSQYLSLSDQSGKPRWLLGVSSDGASMLSAVDGTGKKRVGIVLDRDGALPNLFIHDKDEAPRLLLGESTVGGFGLTLTHKSQPRASIGMGPDGASVLRLRDSGGRVVWKAP